MPKAAALLNETLQEEMKAEKLLTQIGSNKADKMPPLRWRRRLARMKVAARPP
jgi:hypothetical protein